MNKVPKGYKVWHLLVSILVLYYVPVIYKMPIWLWKTILNRQMARRMRQERDAKFVDFEKMELSTGKVDRDKLAQRLLTAMVKDLRQGLMNREFTSLDLVVFYGKRTQEIGRKMNYSTEELFKSAI